MTVGYGDIRGYNSSERIFCMILMLIGVVSFSYLTGSLTSMISRHDIKEQMYKEKVQTLNDLMQEFDLDYDVYNSIQKALQYNHSNKSKDIVSFVDELPHKLRIELIMILHA